MRGRMFYFRKIRLDPFIFSFVSRLHFYSFPTLTSLQQETARSDTQISYNLTSKLHFFYFRYTYKYRLVSSVRVVCICRLFGR